MGAGGGKDKSAVDPGAAERGGGATAGGAACGAAPRGGGKDSLTEAAAAPGAPSRAGGRVLADAQVGIICMEEPTQVPLGATECVDAFAMRWGGGGRGPSGNGRRGGVGMASVRRSGTPADARRFWAFGPAFASLRRRPDPSFWSSLSPTTKSATRNASGHTPSDEGDSSSSEPRPEPSSVDCSSRHLVAKLGLNGGLGLLSSLTGLPRWAASACPEGRVPGFVDRSLRSGAGPAGPGCRRRAGNAASKCCCLRLKFKTS